DRYDIEGTPPGISRLILNNALNVQDTIYASTASVPIIANGNYSIELGLALGLDGTITQLQHLSGLPISITLNFSGDPTGDVLFAGNLDPIGASYIIDGVGILHIVNINVGLNLTINGYRDQDQVHILLAGGSVNADLRQTGGGTIF